MSQPVDAGLDYRTICQVLGFIVMGVLSFFGAILWKDVREIKERWATREDLEAAQAKADVQRDEKHLENTGNFRRLEEKVDAVQQAQHQTAIAIEKRLGEVLVEMAKRPHRPDGPERRRF